MLVIGIISLILYSSYNKLHQDEIKNIYRISGIIIIYSIIILYNSINIIYIGKSLILFNDIIVITTYSIYIKLLLLILTFIYILLKYEYININNISISRNYPVDVKTGSLFETNYLSHGVNSSRFFGPESDYIIIILINLLGMSIFIESYNLILIYIVIELQSYSVYIITTISPKNIKLNNNLNYDLIHGGGINGSYKSSKSGLIYFLLGSLASIIILIGLVLLYSITGLINLYDINILLNNNDILINNKLMFSYLLILIGLLFKIGVAPFHNWLINIYVNVPTIVTVWISIVTKISILTFIYNLLYNSPILYINNNLINIIYILSIISILSMSIGGLGGLSQINIKRIIAYSGLANTGYMLYTIIANNQLTLQAYLFNISQYSLTHFNWFLILLLSILSPLSFNIIKKSNSLNENSINESIKLQNIIGYNINNPYIIFCYIVTLSSLIGIPPLAGFYGKYYMIISGLYSGYILSTIILVLISGITAYYYSFIISLISFKIYNNRKNILNYKSLNSGFNVGNIGVLNTIKLTYIICYIISIITFILLLPLLLLDIYTNGSTILDYYQYII